MYECSNILIINALASVSISETFKLLRYNLYSTVLQQTHFKNVIYFFGITSYLFKKFCLKVIFDESARIMAQEHESHL